VYRHTRLEGVHRRQRTKGCVTHGPERAWMGSGKRGIVGRQLAGSLWVDLDIQHDHAPLLEMRGVYPTEQFRDLLRS
jgi:hypothetical protein